MGGQNHDDLTPAVETSEGEVNAAKFMMAAIEHALDGHGAVASVRDIREDRIAQSFKFHVSKEAGVDARIEPGEYLVSVIRR